MSAGNVLINQARWEKILALDLKRGGHNPDSTFCVMEAAAYVAGEPWSDHPQCVDRVIADVLISKNDSLPSDAERNRLLRPLIPRIVGTRGSAELSQRRAWMVIDWVLRTAVPMLLRTLQMEKEAAKWEALEEFTSSNARALALALDLDLDRALARDLALALDRALALEPPRRRRMRRRMFHRCFFQLRELLHAAPIIFFVVGAVLDVQVSTTTR